MSDESEERRSRDILQCTQARGLLLNFEAESEEEEMIRELKRELE